MAVEKLSLGEFICERRKRLGMTQAQLAEKVGVSNRAVSKWETLESNPELSNIPSLAAALYVSADELLNCKIDEKEKEQTTDRTMDEIIAGVGLGFEGAVNKSSTKYEYVSKGKTKKGTPYVHICFGIGKDFGAKAKGVVAIGNRAKGIVALGFISMGIFSIGLISIGVIALGCIALGFLAAIGAVSIAAGLAVGGVAAGFVAIGGVAIGFYSIGGVAIGVHAHTGEDGLAIGIHKYIHKIKK